jgi:signal transduction histidine kinase
MYFITFGQIKRLLKYLILSLVFTVKIGISQDPAYYTIGEKEFANTDIYTMLYDESSDVLYVGTNNGLYVYTQNRFVPVKNHSKQIGSSFFDLKINAIGNIYCSNMSGQIFQVVEDRLQLVYASKKADKYFNSYDIYEETKLIVSNHKSLVIINEDRSQEIVIDNNLSPLIIGKDTIISHGKFNHFGSKSILFGIPKGQVYSILLDSTLQVSQFIKEPNSTNPINQYIEQKGKVYGVKNNGEIKGVGDTIFQEFKCHEKERIYSIDKDAVIGLNSQRGFRYIYLKDDTLTCSSTMFENLFISAFTKLNNNVMLFGTFGEGIRVVSSASTTKSYHEELFLDIATSENNEVAICCRSGEVFKLINNNLELLDKVPHNVDNIYYFPNNKVTQSLGYGDFVYNDSRKQLEHSIDIVATDDSSIFVGTRNSLLAILSKPNSKGTLAVNTSLANEYGRITSSTRVNAVEWDAVDSTFYFSGSSGLYRTKWNEFEIDEVNVSSKSISVNDLFIYDSLLFSSTQTEGVVVSNIRNKEILFRLNTNNGLKSNHVKQAETKDGLLFVITKKGLQIFDVNKKKFVGVGLGDGLEPEKITKFALSNDKLWLIEKHSYLSIDLSKLKESNQNNISTLYFDSIQVNNRVIDPLQVNEFNYRQNAFTFYFDYRNILTKKETVILYTLNGFYDHWKKISTEQNKIEFQSLPVGQYTFRIKAKYRDQESNEFVYNFEIYPPFWQRWWFYVLIGVFTASIIALVAVLRIRNLRRKNKEDALKKEMEKNAIDAQLKAIRAQMNPHFIFNSINAIQDLVLQQETLKSYDYLVDFSKMVRTILDFSEREFIPIQEEIEFLNTYLGLESLRFHDDFSFNIEAKLKSTAVKIPSLIIQPFVENAIKHGLLHKEGLKNLAVTFHKENNHVTCVIEDNGIGISEANEIKSRQKDAHKSFSTEAITKRLKILQSQSEEHVGYVTEELFDNNGISKGTRVTVSVPIIT